MCGIAGIADRNSDSRLAPLADRMVAALTHRGPDAHDSHDFGSCVLGNTRLAIVDLSERGRMPMRNEDGTVWITYNGECYNAAELRPVLQSRGHRFTSTTDTEVIVHLYEEFGEQCVEKLRGMFAFAIWDDRQKKLLLARDRLGIKPLYFSLSSDGILFASEIKALLASGAVDRKVDPAGICIFLQLGHIPPPWTAVQNVRPLEPGHFAVWRDGQFRTRRYWKLPQPGRGSTPPSAQIAAHSLGEMLVESSRLQLMSDVPIALFLSGGVDSAVLGSLMRAAGAENVTALTIGFREAQYDESAESRETARLLGVAHQVLELDPGRVAGSLDNVIWAMDQPTVDGLNAYWISRAASEAGFKVTLSGQGGDELFGGYDSIAWFSRFASVASWMRPFPSVAGRYLFDHDALPFRLRKLRYLVGSDDPFVAAQMAVRVLFPDRDTRELLVSVLPASGGCVEASSFIESAASDTKGCGVSDRVALLDFTAHLEPRLLRDGDAMSMAHSLEVRPVLLDHAIVEYVMSLPANVRFQNKKLLLDAVRSLMPAGLFEAITARPKRTFTFPFTRWLGEGLRPAMEGAFHPQRANESVLDSATVQKLWKRYVADPSSVGWSRIWSLFVLSRWCETMRVGA